MESNNIDMDKEKIQSINDCEDKLIIISSEEKPNQQIEKEEALSKEQNETQAKLNKNLNISPPKEVLKNNLNKHIKPVEKKKKKKKHDKLLTDNFTLENCKKSPENENIKRTGKMSYLNNYKKDTSEKKETNMNKTVFSEITESMYLFAKEDKLPVKKARNLEKQSIENYNKLTVEAYLCSCANKANKDNKKIIYEFLGRKKNEEISKKIGLDQDKDNKMENLQDVKRLTILTDRNRCYVSTRTFNEFLNDQKEKEEERQNHLKVNETQKKEELKTCLRDKPELNKESIKLAKNISKNARVNIYSRLYQDYNEKKIKEREKELENKALNEKNENIKKTQDKIQQNVNRLFHDYETKKKKMEISNAKNLELRNFSANHSIMNKNSKDIIFNRFKKNFENALENILSKKINEQFEINYMDFVKLLFNLNFTNKNYYELIQNKDCKDVSEKAPEPNEANKNDNKELDRKKNFENDKEYKLILDAWKIIIKSKEFNSETPGSSKRLLLFFLSLLGIYNGNNDNIIKKEFPILADNNNDDKSSNYANLSKQIYKYFYLYRNNAINGSLFRERNEKKRQGEGKSVERSSKNFFKNNHSVPKMHLSVKKKYEQYQKNKEYKLKEKEKLLEKEEKEKCPFAPPCAKIKGKVNIIEISERLYNNGRKHLKNNNSISNNLKLEEDNKKKQLNVDNSKKHKNNKTNNSIQKMFNNNPLEKDVGVKKKIEELKESRNQKSLEKMILKKGFKPKENTFKDKDISEFNELIYKNERFAHDDEPLNYFKNTFKKYEKLVPKPQKEKYVFEIIIDGKPKKLLIYENEDINYKVKEFCNVYKLNYNDKKLIFQTINQNIIDKKI